jgi:hypothetical protein
MLTRALARGCERLGVFAVVARSRHTVETGA